jgi:NADH:ubiquinone oxidoreductase subunit
MPATAGKLSNGQAFQPGTQEKNTAISIFALLYRGIANIRRILYQRQITIYETNNTPLPHQYRRWMHSTVNELRQHAHHHAKQREHARGLGI